MTGVRALWSEMVLELSLREWRERKEVPPLISVTDLKGNYDHLHNETIGPSEDRRIAIVLAIIREDLSRQQVFLRWVNGKAQVADALTKLHGDGDLLRTVCRQAFTVLVEAPKIMAARRQERRERERVPRVKSPLKLREPVDETSMSCDTDANRDLTRHPFLTLKPCHVIQPSGSRTSLGDQCFLFAFVRILWSFVTRSALVPLESVAIPETVLTSLLLRHYKQLSSGLHTLSSPCCSPAHACALSCICRANLDHVEHVTQV